MFKTINGALNNSIKFRGLVKQLVSRDIKLKYRRSILGYLWSVLNPLFTMLVLTIVFSNFFKFNIKNFPVYLLSGQIIFNVFSISTSSTCFTIIENGALLKKTYVPKYLFIFSKVTSCFIEYLFSLIALFFVMLLTKSKFSFYNLLFIIPSIEIYIFSIGMGLFLSQANVFFRDVNYLYSVFLTALNYLTPIFYPIEILPDAVRNIVVKFNPLYIFVDVFRSCIYSGVMPDWHEVLSGMAWACGAFVFGALLFKKNQHKFILYI